jgi:sugar-specific transcriptional regulator TrmB
MNGPDEEATVPFKELGFTEYETKVYLALLREHPASAYTISRNSGVPHSRVYDVARRLIKKGVLGQASTNPDRFTPLSPRDLIEKLRKDNEHFLARIEEHLQSLSFSSDFDPVWNVNDRREALGVAHTLIEESTGRIYLGLWDEELHELIDVLRAAHERGVEVFFLVYGEALPEFGHVYHHQTESISGVDELGRTIDCAVDSASCLSGSLGAAAPCQVVWTRNRGLVKSIEEYIVHDLYLAEIHARFGGEIDGAFGEDLKRLRRKYGR